MIERLGRIRQYFRQPTFRDPELDHQAALLYAALKPIVAITLALAPGLLIVRSPLVVEIPVLIMLAVEGLVFWLLRRGRVQAGSTLLISVGWCVTVLPAFLQGGLSSPFILFSMLWVVVSGLLVDTRFMLGMLVLNIATISAMLFTTHLGIIPVVIPQATPLRTWLVLMLVLFNAASLVRLSLLNMRQNLEEARTAQVSLFQSNAELRAAREELETRVAERTADLERRAREMQTSSEVVRAIASIRDQDALLNEITHLLSEQFGFYHSSVFLVDENQQLVMRAANTQTGLELVQNDFSVPLDQTSIISTAIRTRKPYLAADVSKDLLYLKLDEFPDTRSELALPLISSERVLGALDLQSTSIAAFSQQDLGILQTLANQIAIAIENARLFTENQQALESLQRAYGSLSQEGWQKLLRAQPNLGYRVGAVGRPVAVGLPAGAGLAGGAGLTAEDAWPPEMRQALNSGKAVLADPATLAVPIKIRDQATGVIRLRKPVESGAWTPAEIDLVETLSDRLSTALESARLYEETRRRAERERLTGEITARMRTSNDPQAILQIAARELRKALQADKAQLMVQSVPVGTLQPEEAKDGTPAEPDGAPQQGGKL